MAKNQPKSLFRRLTRLFRSGPIVKRKIRALDTTIAIADKTKSSGTLLFQKSLSPTYATITSNAYNLSERLMRYQDFQEMEYSLAKSTLIATPDGFKTIGELAAECSADPDKTFIVYSYDHEKRQIVPALGKQARQTCVDHAWKVTFDNGKSITLSAEHRLMLRDGTYRKAKDLQPGDAMMPFYRKDLFAGAEEGTKGYSWVYTMDDKFRGWTKEHQLIAEWVAGRELTEDECVHHVNFVKTDNKPENLRIMTKSAHSSYHATLNNAVKWAPENHVWIEEFKRRHSEWMKQHNPAERRDVTFPRILEVADQIGFNLPRLAAAFDTDANVIKRRLRANGFADFETFARAYSPGWQNGGWDNAGDKNPHYDHGLTFESVCKAFVPGMSAKQLASKLETSDTKVVNRVKQAGHKTWSAFAASYQNCKVASIEYVGEMPLYDLTVDGYKNFATDSVISHNTPEIAAALDIYADETCAQDEKGRIVHIYSDNEKIRELLEDLFYNILNVEFNLRSWARNLPVRKDSVIPLLDGRNITIEQLAREHEKGKENWVYSVQDGTLRTVPGKVAWCGLTRKDSELVRVWLDDGTYVDCTPDHRFTLRDGSSVEAQHLAPETSLMPFYRKTSKRAEGAAMEGYEEVYDAASGRYVYTHRRVTEVLEKGTLKNGRWLVTHHRDFDKRNNDPQNLVRMDEKEHMELHRQLAIEILHSPEVTAKRMAGIDRWLRSDEHRMLAKEQLKKLQDAGLMKASWDDYNTSPQAKQDNEKRSRLKKEMWADDSRRSKAQAKMAIKFDQRCIDLVVEALETHGKYVSPKVLGNQLKSDEAFMGYFKAINEGTKRDLTKPFNSHAGFENLLQKAGIVSYLELVKDRLPVIAATSWFQRAEKKSQKMTGVVPAMRDVYPSTKSTYKNHKVARVEKLTETDDVYCMEVLGPEGEHDRHRFMAVTNQVTTNGATVQHDTGICLENCKYGDFFLYNDVSPEYGVINAFPIPVNEVEREENYDRDDPFAVRYRWVTLGNRTLENWEVTHFRLLGNDMFLPYGSSIIEPARRIWRQLILIEDAMLVYRVVRAPERRVFYIDVANIPPHEVPQYVEQQRQQMRTTPVIDRQTGRVDIRYNPMSVEEDYFIPVRGGESGTKIDTLAGGQNTAAVEDVAYIQKKLFAALKIPRAYLGYDEMLSSKATLAQEDIRFSRTINVIQKTMMAELNKLAIIHLYAHGYDNEDLQDFTLRLSNPSTVAQQQKLELWRAKFEIAGSAPEGMGSKLFIRKEIWGLNDEQIKQMDDQRLKEKLVDAAIEASTGGEAGEGGEGGVEDLFGAAEGGEAGGEEPAETPPEENAGEEPEEEVTPGLQLITSEEDNDDDESFALKLGEIDDKPVNVQSQLDKVLYNRSRRRTHGASKTHTPDFVKMTGNSNHAMEDPYDNDWIKSVVNNPFGEAVLPRSSSRLTSNMMSTLHNMSISLKMNRAASSSSNVLAEGKDVQDEIDRGQINLDLIDRVSQTSQQLNENDVVISSDEDNNEDDE